MATLALSLAGQVVGGAIGGPIGATIGRALGALAGSAVDQALFADRPVARQGADIRLIGSSEGGPIARVYGWSRVSGNIIWATQLQRIAAQSSGSKGFGNRPSAEDTIVANFALALCEGPVAHIGRIWADGKPLETDGLNIRIHRGTENQSPDSLIAARQGAGQAPAYRGLCYIVFEQLPLTPFGNRIPNISVEVCRPVGDLEPAIKAMCLMPGSTEFGYDPVPRVQIVGPGRTRPENAHMSAARSDWDISIDELVALCPNLEHVGLVVAWFGTDLRCGHCVVEPRVESTTRTIKDAAWAVAGRTRGEANVVSISGGGPAYGGTPSDASVIAAIKDLRARGIKVTLYPFVMMDVPSGNTLTDPYTGEVGQPAYPWRGRITCAPAPRVAGSPDGTGGATPQVTAFVANGYREMILHYAQLGMQAGGVDAILIGSEMGGLTTVRSGPTSFPFVDALSGLAGEVRAIVGTGTKISYAADWSEYSGLQPVDAPGDKIFHLDPLWADANIDAVGIDNYMPLSDWRDGTEHLDAQAARSIYEPDYLAGNIAGGEGFDWFYASEADRVAQIRTPISDGEHGQAWVWRYKDMVNWWSQPHYNRVGGVRSATATAWVPRAKPIWLTELGCGAVDKGPNAPNAFGDPKSSEDKRPPFSSGQPDALIQRQMLRACHGYWQGGDEEKNPISPVYGGPMLDPDRIYLWAWDARPFPAFPGLSEVWSDWENHATGHWLNGRLGAASAEEYVRVLAGEYDVVIDTIDAALPLIEGLVLEGVVSLRDAAAPITDAAGLRICDGIGGLSWVVPDAREVLSVAVDDMVRSDGPVVGHKRADAAERPGQITLRYTERGRDYQAAVVLATAPDGGAKVVAESGLVLDPSAARRAAEGALCRARVRDDGVNFSLPPSLLALEAADLVVLPQFGGKAYVVGEIRDGDARRVGGTLFESASVAVASPPPRIITGTPPPAASEPVFCLAHIPAIGGGTALECGAFADPWPGDIVIRDLGAGADLAILTGPAAIGFLGHEIGAGPDAVWARDQTIEVRMLSGHLASVEPQSLLAAGNRIAVEGADGQWEVIAFAKAELVAPDIYRLRDLLRGQRGTLPQMAPEGSRVLVLGQRTQSFSVPETALGSARNLRAYAGTRDGTGTAIEIDISHAPALPLSPVHLDATFSAETGDVALTWIRRTRNNGDGWTVGEVPLDFVPEAYRVTIFDGDTPIRTETVAASGYVYASAHQTADFGAAGHPFTYTVQQLSPVLGPGAASSGSYP